MNGLEDIRQETYETGSRFGWTRVKENMSSVGPPRAPRRHYLGRVHWSTLFVGLIMLSASTLVIGAEDEVVTLFRDDFDSDQNQWWRTGGSATATVRNGYLFLNVSETGIYSQAELSEEFSRGAQWRYAGFEVRLRWIGPHNGSGLWGLSDYLTDRPPSDEIAYNFYSDVNPVYPQWRGLKAYKWLKGNSGPGANFQEDISEIGMGEWHTYTIVCGREEAEYIVDGEVMATTLTIDAPMGVKIRIDNDAFAGGRANLSGDVCLQVDYVHVFWSQETFQQMSEEMEQLLSQASDVFDTAVDAGAGDLKNVKDFLDDAREDWEERHYSIASDLESVVSLCEGWISLAPRFVSAELITRGVDTEDPHTAKLNGLLEEAWDAWNTSVRVFPANTETYRKKSDKALFEIEAYSEVVEGDCFARVTDYVTGITDDRSRLVADTKLRQATNAWDAGDFSVANNYLDQLIECGELGPVVAMLLFLLFPVLSRSKCR